MAEHHKIDRVTSAEWLRELADHVEEGRVEGLWVVATSAPGASVEGARLSLLGPSTDDVACARLYLRMERLRHLLLDSLNQDASFQVLNQDEKEAR